MQLTESVQMTNALPTKWIAHLMIKMQAMYGAKFSQQWQGIDPDILQTEWAEQLAGFSGDELKRGLQACRERPWPPTLPEFMVLCRPPVLPEPAFYEAVTGLSQRRRGEYGDWAHPAIFHAAVKVGAHDMLNGSYQQLRARWEKALSVEMEKTDWAPIPEAHVALPEPKKTEMTDAEAAQAMKRIGADKVLDKKGTDTKAWARRIVESPQGRPLIAVTMAKRALELS